CARVGEGDYGYYPTHMDVW
nr:immunoglobulin heavy chain junction region [Macaca mulatta]MOW46728.1 immunoglobulin heavy chain junction region [Macaca mulatta]MOW46922.1 immunoglobulin heavy chain junction region [Macaca mulatta]MOW47616.1 immunoglobulin heavy chain junction region [Macaca mulatta]MOW49069.1 immunoglobulin heavy chain junction region [Macaca mulatta]